tara:strand:+ start:94810 stop:95610 length:801 start_codon:yes stop_codon:yes gene_type:complete
MTKYLLVYTLFFQFIAHSYTLEQISLSDYEFRRYVRPQLRSISQDYQTLLFALNPHLKDFKGSFNSVRKLFILKNDLQTNCDENFINPKCYQVIEEMSSITKDLINAKVSMKNLEMPTIDELVYIELYYELYQNKMLKLYTSLQNLKFQHDILEFFIFDKLKVINQINIAYTELNLLLLNVSMKEVRSELVTYWNGFIKPVTEYIIVENRMTYFKNNITKLNVNWNLLNVKLTKRNIPISKQVKTLLNIMHNRWNNILKVSLNTKG